MDWSYYTLHYYDNEYQNSDDIYIQLRKPFYPHAADCALDGHQVPVISGDTVHFLVARFYRKSPPKSFSNQDLFLIILNALLQSKDFDFEPFSEQLITTESFGDFPAKHIPNTLRFCREMLENREDILEKAKQLYIKEKL